MITRKSILFLFLGVLGIFGGLIIIYLLVISIGGDDLKQYLFKCWLNLKDILLANGFLLFLSIAILPGLILPVAPLLTLAGIWGSHHGPGYACFFCILSLTVNLIWTYLLAHGPARNLIQRKLAKNTKFKLPTTAPRNLLQWALILRLTPGVPFIFANYALGVLQMPFVSYLLLSVSVLSATTCGYVLAFAGIFSEDWKYLWLGFSMIVIMLLLGKFILKRSSNAN